MKINSFSNIFFQKKLVAKCKVGEQGLTKNAFIYQLEKPLDCDYYSDQELALEWKHSFYLKEVKDDISKSTARNDKSKFEHYVMENEDGLMICYSAIRQKHNGEHLEYIETMPCLSSYNIADRKIKYIGETMLAFLTTIASKLRKDLIVPNIAQRPKTLEFYYRLCKMHPLDGGAKLEKKDFDKLLKQNETHTGSSIELV